jgi:hypothetical protein
MKLRTNHGRLPSFTRCRRTTARPLACLCLAIAAALACSAQTVPTTGSPLRFDKVDLPTPINQPPDANVQMEEHDPPSPQPDFAAANAERKKQIADDSAKLLKLAVELNAEMAKTAKDTLSLIVIRKADEIERLAHTVKQKMKLTAGVK